MAVDLARIFSLLGGLPPGVLLLYILVTLLLTHNGVPYIKKLFVQEKAENPHDNQKRKDAIIHISKDARALLEQRERIDHYHILEEQMRYADELIDKIKNEYVDRYIELLKKNDTTLDNNEFLRFEMVMGWNLEHAKDFIRYLMRRNSLNELSTKEASAYIDKNLKVFMSNIERNLDKVYPLFSFSVDRHEFYQSTRNERGNAKQLFADFIYQARDISEKRNSEMKVIDTKLAEMLNEILEDYEGESA